MKFVIRAIDGERKLEKRMEVRSRHFEDMDRMKEHLVCAGGLLDEEGNLKGSVYVLEHVWEKITVDQMNVAYLDGKKVTK